ncbi:lPS biosynthesis protein [Candidatus Apopatosoma intestinale]|nr:lPS biosynthesis protein [Candidatus Apopatosoma intestinale]
MTIRKLNLNEIRDIEFGILLHFKDFCKKNNIRFFLSNGSLLGAIKYNGFIPWDDDIDVFVPREDYEKLLKIYCDGEQYCLISRERQKSFRYPFAKLCNVATIKQETQIDNGLPLGLDIDIFPLDKCSKKVLKPLNLFKLKIAVIGCSLSKFQSYTSKNILKQWAYSVCKVFGYDFFYNKLLSVAKKMCASDGELSGCLSWPIYGYREFVPSEIFGQFVLVEFNGEIFPAPSGYDVYLRSLYGDYTKDPPIEKQKSHHSFDAFAV